MNTLAAPRLACRACRDGTELGFAFTMAFQPIVDVARGQVWGYEALVRGPHGEGAGSILSQVTEETLYRFDQAARVKAIELAGRLFHASHAPAPGLVHTLVWDGRDAYDRAIQGEQRYRVQIAYVYRAVYGRPRLGDASFALASGQAYDIDLDRSEYRLYQRYDGTIGGWLDGAETGLAGWSLSHLHYYDVGG